MRFSTTAGALRDALTTARHATPAIPSLVAYSGALLLVKGERLSVIGSDGETTISAVVAVSGATDGQILLPPKPLGAWLATLAADAVVEVEAGDGVDVEVRAGKSAPYRFRPLAATFPLPAAPKSAPRAVDLSRLGAGLAAVRTSVAKEAPGVQLVSSAEGLILHSTDNYRLSRSMLPEAGFGEFTGLVSLSVLDRVARHQVSEVSVDARARTLRFGGPEVVISTRLLGTPFPAVEAVLGATPPFQVGVEVEGLRTALSRLAAIAEASPLRCRLDDSVLVLSVENTDLGSGSEEVPLTSAVAAPFEFAVKLAYLVDAVHSHDTDEVVLGWSGSMAALYLNSVSPLPVTSVVMPVRL